MKAPSSTYARPRSYRPSHVSAIFLASSKSATASRALPLRSFTAAPSGEAFKLDLALIDSIDDVLRVREVRRALEAETAALAAERASRGQVTALRKALRAIDRSAADTRDGVEEDLAFHRLLAEAEDACRAQSH